MIYLSVLSFTAALLYLYVGFNTFLTNTNSKLLRIFLLLTLSLTIWSFADGFLYLSDNVSEYSLWNKVGAFGWCTFEALGLYFVLLFTDNKYMKNNIFKIILLAPGAIFLYMVLFLFGPNIKTKPIIENIFYTGNFIYNFAYLLLCILFITLWGCKSNSRIHKKQAIIISVSSLIPFFLNLLFGHVLPMLGILNAPAMGQIFSVIMILGVNYAITQYQFMSITTTQITQELFNELNGLSFLLDSEGHIMKANQQVYTFLDCSSCDIIGKHITDILDNNEINELMKNCESITEKIQFDDIDLTLKSSKLVPFHFSIIPLHSKSNLLRGILLIGEDISTTKSLQDEIKRHKITNNRLKNSEVLFRKMLEITPVAIMLFSKQTRCVVYLNNQAIKIFGAEKTRLIGSHITDYFINKDDIEIFRQDFYENKEIKKAEFEFLRKDGTSFIGLFTAIPSIYHEEEVALSCIVDLTDQKRTEEELKRNNEYIKELNAELVILNNNLLNKSIKDGLTNLYNHQYINDILESKLEEASEHHEDLCVIMMDIDHFKNVNDRFGHMVGDNVLSELAKLIVMNTGTNAYIGRYGGEEFIAILPKTHMEDAVVIAEKVRSCVENHNFGRDDLRVTISVGLVQYTGETAKMLVNKADMLLYQAKHNGRNRVENQWKEEIL